jgi:hypothetical protein
MRYFWLGKSRAWEKISSGKEWNASLSSGKWNGQAASLTKSFSYKVPVRFLAGYTFKEVVSRLKVESRPRTRMNTDDLFRKGKNYGQLGGDLW